MADTGNNRVQVFDAASFAYVETIGISSGASGTSIAAAGNTSFNAPGGMYSDAGTGRLYVADTGNQRVQIFDTATLAYIGTLGSSGASGIDNAHFNAPTDITVNAAVGEILVADSGNARVQRFDAKTLAYRGTIGGPGLSVGDSDYLGSRASSPMTPRAIWSWSRILPSSGSRCSTRSATLMCRPWVRPARRAAAIASSPARPGW